MKPKRPLNVGAVSLIKGKIRNDLVALRVAVDHVEQLLDETTFENKPFSAIAVIIFYADVSEITPSFERVKGEFLDVEIGLEMKKLQMFAKSSRLADVFIWALLETLRHISQKYDMPIEDLDAELAKYEKIKDEFV